MLDWLEHGVISFIEYPVSREAPIEYLYVKATSFEKK
jgi:hypothetical protein